MALPVIDKPTYKVYLPGCGREVTLRAFTVAEQKILLQAKEEKGSDAESKKIDAITQVLQLCVLDDIDLGGLALFDFEILFIKLRAVSVDNMATMKYVYSWHDHENNDKPMESELTVKIPLNLLMEPKAKDGHTDTVMVNDTVGIKLKYPSVRLMTQKLDDYELIKKCIDYVFDGDEVYDKFTDEEIDGFVDSLDMKALAECYKFFDTAPSLYYEKEVTLDDGTTTTLVYESLSDFFI